MARTTQRRWLGGLGIVAIALVGCGGGGGDDAGADGDEVPTETTLGPLAKLLGWDNPDEAESRRMQLAVEEQVAQCMRAEGWEYTPVDWSAMQPEPVEDEEIYSDPQAFGETYGYGVVHNYEQWEESNLGEGGPAAAAAEKKRGPIIGPDGEEFVDPNETYRQTLSESEQEQYWVSLNGDPAIWEESDDPDWVPPTPEEQGCYGVAQADVYGQDPYQSNPDLAARLDDFWANMESDPLLVEAYQEWVTCMGAGLDGVTVGGELVDNPNQMYQVFEERKNLGMGLEMVPWSEDDAETTDFYTAYSDETGEGVAFVGDPQPIPEDVLEELRADEVDTWKADNECQQEARISEVRAELEQRFADELAAEFPELTTPGS